MTEQRPDVLVVGAGLAGLAAAVRAAELGLRVRVVEQAPVMGGAVMRQPLDRHAQPATGPHDNRWLDLMRRLKQQQDHIVVSTSCQYAGIDATGVVVLVHLLSATHESVRPRAVVVATGATERVRPRPGWHHPGVQTAGAIQIGLKMSHRPPKGRVLLAGNGPLLLAVAAQLVAHGMPPLAVLEAGHPMAQWRHSWALPATYWREAVAYRWTLWRARVPYLTRTTLDRIETIPNGLVAHTRGPRGTQVWHTDWVGLHDGLIPNPCASTVPDGVVWEQAGDCAQTLGARAAWLHGTAVGQRVATALAAHPAAATAATQSPAWASEVQAQQRLRRIFAHDDTAALAQLPMDTVICRCENRTLADLRGLGERPTVREARLQGRFAMGGCQGRFCADWVQQLCGGASHNPQLTHLRGQRWPVRPLSIQALVSAPDSQPPASTDMQAHD